MPRTRLALLFPSVSTGFDEVVRALVDRSLPPLRGVRDQAASSAGWASALALVLLTLLLALPAFPVEAKEPLRLTVVHFNDLDRMEAREERGGMAKVAAVIARARAEADHVLVTHGGDALSPSTMSAFDRGAHMIDLLNRLGPDLFVLGNHEFDFGPEVLLQRVAEADFPVLGANVRTPENGLPEGVRERMLLTVGDWRIGAFGLTTPQTAVVSSPAPLSFLPEIEVAAEQAEALRAEGADFVIALAHSDSEVDSALIRQGAANLILGGHDEELRLLWRPGGTAFVESGSQGDYVTLVHLLLEQPAAGGTVWSASFEVVDTRLVEPEAGMSEAVAGHLAALQADLAVELVVTDTELDTRRESVRRGESAFGSLVAEALREASGADAAIQNGGALRGDRLYPAGSRLTRGDIVTELPFGNELVLLEVTGATLRAALEHGVDAIEELSGRFPQVAGLRFRYDPRRPQGRRLLDISLGDAPLDPAGTYRLAVNSFIAGGGDGYDMLAAAPRVAHPAAGKTDAAVVIDHLERFERIAPHPDGRITLEE